MDKTYKDLVNDRENDNAELYSRMDEDKDLLNLTKYIMKDDRNRQIADIVNVTLNMPSYMATNILTDLSAATEQIVVDSRDLKFDTATIEEIIRCSFDSANESLKKRGKVSLNEFSIGQLCLRGRAARRVLFRNDGDGNVVSDISNWDTRFMSQSLGEWSAYHMKKTKDQVFADYGEIVRSKEVDCLDVWDRNRNEVWIDNRLVVAQSHGYGFVPVVFDIVSLGSGGILLDSGNKRAEGESIFFMIRPVVPELNRLASIMQTLNLKAVKVPMVYKNTGGKGAAAPNYEDVTSLGAITSIAQEDDISPINYGDAQRSAQMAYQMMMNAFEAGGMTSAELGILGKPPASGVALLIAGEGRDRIYHPRLVSLNNLNTATARMICRQLAQEFPNSEIELGNEGYEQRFNTSSLDGNYKISFRYSVRSQEIDAGRATLAAAYGHLLPDRVKREEVLLRDDPKRDEDLLRYQEAEQYSPLVKLYRIMESLVRLDMDFEAELMAKEFDVNLDRLLAGEVPEMPTQKPENPKQVISLFGGGGARTPGMGEEQREESNAT